MVCQPPNPDRSLVSRRMEKVHGDVLIHSLSVGLSTTVGHFLVVEIRCVNGDFMTTGRQKPCQIHAAHWPIIVFIKHGFASL